MPTERVGVNDFVWPPPSGPWSVHVGWAVIDGRVECAELQLQSEPPQPITSHMLRSLHQHISQIRDQRKLTVRQLHRSAPSADVRRRASRQLNAYESEFHRRGGRPPLPANHYVKVAQLYVEARTKGRPPTKAVALAMNASRSTAANWVARCRELGLLGPTKDP